MKPRILLVDDHTIVLQGLRTLLQKEFEILLARDAAGAIKAITDFDPNVVVLDVSMPVLSGFDAARQIRKIAPHIKVVFLTMHTDPLYVQEAFDAGASAYVAKFSASETLQHAIREVLSGRNYITPALASPSKLSKRKQQRHGLTPRQLQIVKLIAEGKSAKEAAATLAISPRTVEFHKYQIMQQLGLKTTAQLTQYAIRTNIIAGD
jgi:DNA-binding NarL/FixJ family response regulator